METLLKKTDSDGQINCTNCLADITKTISDYRDDKVFNFAKYYTSIRSFIDAGDTSAIKIGPAEKAQLIHYDQGTAISKIRCICPTCKQEFYFMMNEKSGSIVNVVQPTKRVAAQKASTPLVKSELPPSEITTKPSPVVKAVVTVHISQNKEAVLTLSDERFFSQVRYPIYSGECT
jgi:hypothetical protein